jgi:hypothetical protein
VHTDAQVNPGSEIHTKPIKEEELKPSEVQLIADDGTFNLFSVAARAPMPKISDAVLVGRNWEHEGFTYTSCDQRLIQPEPIIMPTSLEILTKPGQNFIVRATMLPIVTDGLPDGWRVKTADEQIHELLEGNLRITVTGEWVKIETFDSKKTDRLSVKTERLLVWGCHASGYRFK